MARVLPAVFVTIVLFQAAWGSAIDPKQVGVTNGQGIHIEDAPYMALLYTMGDAPCGGVIIDNQFIVTTSTCCVGNNKDLYAFVGTNRYEQLGRAVAIERLIKYEMERKPSICLVKLQAPLVFNEQVNKIPLDDGRIALTRDTVATLTAFGAQDQSDRSLRRLRQGQVPISDADWCKKEEINLHGLQFCAGDENSNTCYGDVGGALTIDETLVGVVTVPPNDCKYRPTRFARISAFKGWIEQQIAANQ